MVWGEQKGKQSGLSQEAFLAIARQESIDLTDEAHLAHLYKDVLGMLESIAELPQTSVGLTEPSDAYTPGSEAL